MASVDMDELCSTPTSIRRFRCSLIGKQTLKQAAIRAGVLPRLSQILATAQGDDLFIEAAYLVSILASEGPSYVVPILRSDIPPLLLQHLLNSSQPRSALAILKCLNTIASEVPAREYGQWIEDSTLSELLYNESNIGWCARGLRVGDSSISAQISDLTISLLCKTCSNDTHKSMLTDNGVLHVLAECLASFVVAEGLVAPTLEALDFPANAALRLPEPASPNAHLSPVLEAVAFLLEGSEERAALFISDPALDAVFPHSQALVAPSNTRQMPWGVSGTRSQMPHAIDHILPVVPIKARAGSVSNINFPPLGAGPSQRRRSSFHPNPPQTSSHTFTMSNREVEEEKCIVPFLLLLARESRGKRRLVACKLLTILLDLGLVSKARSRTFGALLVPILVRMLDSDGTTGLDAAVNAGVIMASGVHYSRAAPAVLGLLIMDDADFQKAAVEASAIPKLSNSLKKSFDAAPSHKKTPWRPYKDTAMDVEADSDDRVLGPFSPSNTTRREMEYREGILQALGAIAPSNDEYRRKICDQGVLPQIMQGMEPFTLQKDASGTEEICGNSAQTILAACGCVRALTRSVTALRTRLVDADVAKSVVRLIDNPDPEVRIAATKVLTNLVMDFSPMKDSFTEDAVVDKLCEQAHSDHSRLRLESLWALRQLAVNASLVLKMKIVDNLSCEWIYDLIRADPRDTLKSENTGPMVGGESALQRTVSEDVIMRGGSDDGDNEAEGPIPQSRQSQSPSRRSNGSIEDEYRTQEQVFDLLRNLFCGETAADMIDIVVPRTHHDAFFQILRKRITTRSTHGATRKMKVDDPPPAGIVSRILYIVIHIAACSQIWRVVLVKQTLLLKTILGFHSHKDREVRSQICWLAINLMFEDEGNDKSACSQRAMELVGLGFRDKILRLETDPDLDVRERARSAALLFSQFLPADSSR